MEESIFDLTCCPLCGGKTGFVYKATTVGQQYQAWVGCANGGTFFEGASTKHSAYRCSDCLKIIRFTNYTHLEKKEQKPMALFHGNGGYKGERDAADLFLERGKSYEINNVRVGRFETEIYLVKFPHRGFNSAMFDLSGDCESVTNHTYLKKNES